MDQGLDAVKADREAVPGRGFEDGPVELIPYWWIYTDVGDAHAHDIGMNGVAVDLLGGVLRVLRRHDVAILTPSRF